MLLKICILCHLIECKVWRNPLNLFRGAEYLRFTWKANKDPLTYYDMNLSAQDHQTFFTCDADAGKPEYESKYHTIQGCVKSTTVNSQSDLY